MTIDLIDCHECEGLWGALYDDEREEPYARWNLMAGWAYRHQEPLPDVRIARVVFITESTSRFAYEHLSCDAPEGDCWYDVNEIDMPSWLLKKKRHRWAVKADRCHCDPRLTSPRPATMIVI